MASEPINEKLSIKNLLFTKAIPNHVIPFSVAGYKVYACIDCSDRFLLESSYDYHVNRKSVLISYMCRHCGQMQKFYNRCNLLSHIRSHAFRTATINVYDLKIEPLPLSHFSYKHISTNRTVKTTKNLVNQKSTTSCFECKKCITSSGVLFKDRQNHFMQYTNEVHSCPICLFTLPTVCGLRTHIRLHLRCPPYICPECGIHFGKTMFYPYNHDCEGFKMMRATTRVKCSMSNCHMFHPNEYKSHIKQKHLKKVYKCPFCVVACFNENTIETHLKGHKTDARASIFYQCELCPGKLVLQNHMDTHLKGHLNTVPVFPCWICGNIFKEAAAFIEHHILQHVQTTEMKSMYISILDMQLTNSNKPKNVNSVVKRCEQCLRCFTYICNTNETQNISNECPYRCNKDGQLCITDRSETGSNTDQPLGSNTVQPLKCNLCKSEITDNWENIKIHFGTHHKSHRCLDLKLVLPRINFNAYFRENKQKRNMVRVRRLLKKHPKRVRRPQNNTVVTVQPMNVLLPTSTNEKSEYTCNKCGHDSENKELLENHMIRHRDPCMAYQCMECGESFVVKPSFSKHLLLEHGIEDTDQYISTKKCYNERALLKTQFNDIIEENLPLKENQCRICRDQFENLEDLEKHFRVHGMAFLLKNTTNKISISP